MSNKKLSMKIYEVILHTKKTMQQIKTEFTELTNEEAENWQKFYSFMDGEKGFVVLNEQDNKDYVFLGLEDQEKNKELFYLLEQDPFMGCYENKREEFDRDWDNGEYGPDGCLHLTKKDVEIKSQIGRR